MEIIVERKLVPSLRLLATVLKKFVSKNEPC